MKFLHEGPIKVTSGRRAGINGMGTLKMIGLSYLLGVLAALSVIIAGVYAYKAATTEVKAAWDFDPNLQPKNFQQHAFGMVNALERFAMISGSYGKKAALWGILSGVLGILAAITPGSHKPYNYRPLRALRSLILPPRRDYAVAVNPRRSYFDFSSICWKNGISAMQIASSPNRKYC
jgi:hypothetical protein